jgi:hypothetical protein
MRLSRRARTAASPCGDASGSDSIQVDEEVLSDQCGGVRQAVMAGANRPQIQSGM